MLATLKIVKPKTHPPHLSSLPGLLLCGALVGILIPRLEPTRGAELAATSISAESLLTASDRSRGGDITTGLTVSTRFTDTEGKKVKVQDFIVRIKGDNARAECHAPEKNRGETILFNGRNLWFYKPGLKKPVAVSSRQRLSGKAANGDIFFTHFSRDYHGKVVGEELVNNTPTYKLELSARDKDVTYDRINYWVSRDQKLGVKAEFLTVQGKVFKVATYEFASTLKVNGSSRPFLSRASIQDPAFPENTTVIDYSSFDLTVLPDTLFDVTRLLDVPKP